MAKLNIEVHNLGEHLQEVVKAYLKQGNPSALLQHLTKAAKDVHLECKHPFDRSISQQLMNDFADLRIKYLRCEDEEDSVPG